MKSFSMLFAAFAVSALAGCCCVERSCQDSCCGGGLFSGWRGCCATGGDCGGCGTACEQRGLFDRMCVASGRAQDCGGCVDSTCGDCCGTGAMLGGRIRGSLSNVGSRVASLRACGQCTDGTCNTCCQRSVLDRDSVRLGGAPIVTERRAFRDARFCSDRCEQAGGCDDCSRGRVALIGRMGGMAGMGGCGPDCGPGCGNGCGQSMTGCGRNGCGYAGRFCDNCRRMGCGGFGNRLHPYGGYIPHTPESQLYGYGPMTPTYAYPYYTTRGPRDFLMDNPPSIGQ